MTADPFGLDSISLDWLRAKPGGKWARYPGALAAWVADMDFPPAPAIAAAVRAVADADDFGYPLWQSSHRPTQAEEAFVASLSSCHMLWFRHLAAKAGFVVERYEDRADGVMAKNAEGKLAMTLLTLRPRVDFAGEKRPQRVDIEALHHKAHEECFIANSVNFPVAIEPTVLLAD